MATKKIIFPMDIKGNDILDCGLISQRINKDALINILNQLIYENRALSYAINEIYKKLGINETHPVTPPPPPRATAEDRYGI